LGAGLLYEYDTKENSSNRALEEGSKRISLTVALALELSIVLTHHPSTLEDEFVAWSTVININHIQAHKRAVETHPGGANELDTLRAPRTGNEVMARTTEWKQAVGKINKEVSNLLDSLIAEGVWEEEKVLLTESQEFTFFAAKTMLDDWKSWKLAQDHPKLLAKTPQFYKGALIQAGTWVYVSDHPAMDKCTAGLFTHAIKGRKGNTMYRVLGVNFDNANNHHLTKFFGQRPDEEWPKQLRESVAIRQDAAERAALLTEAAVGQALEEEKTTTQPILFASTTYDPWGPSNNPNGGWQDTSGTSLYPMLCANDTLTILALPERLSADLAQALEDHNMDKPETETAPIGPRSGHKPPTSPSSERRSSPARRTMRGQ